MATLSKQAAGFLSRATDPTWQDQLRASVRLYLSLNPASTLGQELDDLLKRSEQELLDYLLGGEPPTPAARQRARDFLDMAQCQLLSSTLDVQQLLAELAAERSPQLPSEALNEAKSPDCVLQK
ncbi:hypothetical protein J4D99_05715 [Siccationidurans ginsengisoli]|uniref:hypothetical protein n=1 Tax=Hymenobacter TaxID=89966 RepID=UPI001AAD54E7|nr:MULTISPECIES: hypothetical protein [unclassified Hymenobacter]MBO2030881.1 hypothetical protein [Hymenobacter sp. BT559]